MTDLPRRELRRRFAVGDAHFSTSPLYRELCRAVLGDEDLLDLAALARPGQQPANMLMGAVHLAALEHPDEPFARFFASVAGADAEPAAGAGVELSGFCATHRAEIEATVRARLVQTNAPGRGVSVRLALYEVARRVPGPVTFLEVGPSAGIQLRFDRWALETGGRRFGPDPAPLTLRPHWRGAEPPPDLDATVAIAVRLGVDLHPVDVGDPAERQWLQALVWPEHRDRFEELGRALDVVAADPPEILAGDAIDVLPALDRTGGRLPADLPLVVFHAMVRIHVPADRRTAFDAAIEGLGARRRLLRVSLEVPPRGSPHRERGHLLALHDSEGRDVALAVAEGHGRWIEPLAG